MWEGGGTIVKGGSNGVQLETYLETGLCLFEFPLSVIILFPCCRSSK